jgi:hypothetical protein
MKAPIKNKVKKHNFLIIVDLSFEKPKIASFIEFSMEIIEC